MARSGDFIHGRGKPVDLFEQAVEQGGFPMVDVGDDGDISYFGVVHGNINVLEILANRRKTGTITCKKSCKSVSFR